jgi:hypothetical protein
MDDADQKERLGRLKSAERRRSARETAIQQMLSKDSTGIDEKVATVKTVQREDKTRVISAISSLMGRNGGKPG